jgi:hypothetical protein
VSRLRHYCVIIVCAPDTGPEEAHLRHYCVTIVPHLIQAPRKHYCVTIVSRPRHYCVTNVSQLIQATRKRIRGTTALLLCHAHGTIAKQMCHTCVTGSTMNLAALVFLASTSLGAADFSGAGLSIFSFQPYRASAC